MRIIAKHFGSTLFSLSLFLASTHFSHSVEVIKPLGVNEELVGEDVVSKKSLHIPLAQASLGTVIVFVSIKCPCSNSYLPVIDQLSKDFPGPKFQFVGIHSNPDEEVEKATVYFKEKKLNFPVLRDGDTKIADRYEAFKTPHVFIVSPKGDILFQGGVGNNSHYQPDKTRVYLREALNSINKGQEVQEKEVRTLGCEIKRKKRST